MDADRRKRNPPPRMQSTERSKAVRFTDIHSHFLYGMDDGAQTKEEMEAMLDMAWRDGVRKLTATPHMTPGVAPFDEEKFQSRLAEAREYCKRKKYNLVLLQGAEILYTPALEYYINDHRLMTLEGTGRILVEFSPGLPYNIMKESLQLLQRKGYYPILAHVERYKALHGRNIYQMKKETNVLYQMNCESIIEQTDFFTELRRKKWLRDGLIDYVATDSHNLDSRKSCMKAAFRTLMQNYGAKCAYRLTGSFLVRFGS